MKHSFATPEVWERCADNVQGLDRAKNQTSEVEENLRGQIPSPTSGVFDEAQLRYLRGLGTARDKVNDPRLDL